MKLLLRAVPFAFIVIAWSGRSAESAESARTISFRVNSACTCAECTFEACRKLPRFEGVTKTALSVKARRLDVTFFEDKQPVSALAAAVRKLDVGKDSALLWPVHTGEDAAREAEALSRVPGVSTAKPEPKAGVIAVTFSGKVVVHLAQLDAAVKGPVDAPS